MAPKYPIDQGTVRNITANAHLPSRCTEMLKTSCYGDSQEPQIPVLDRMLEDRVHSTTCMYLTLLTASNRTHGLMRISTLRVTLYTSWTTNERCWHCQLHLPKTMTKPICEAKWDPMGEIVVHVQHYPSASKDAYAREQIPPPARARQGYHRVWAVWRPRATERLGFPQD